MMRLNDFLQKMFDGNMRMDQRISVEANEQIDLEIDEVYVDRSGKICIKVTVDPAVLQA